MLTLVLLPGLDGTCRLFDPVIQAIGSDVSVMPIPYPMNESLGYIELERLVRDSLPKNTPYILLGESFSGPIAVAIAATNPENLKGLILCCSFIRNPRPFLRRLRCLMGVTPISNLSRRIMVNLVLGQYRRAEISDFIIEATQSFRPEVVKRRLIEILDVDVAGELSQVVVPSMYLRASNDRVVPPSASELVSGIMPHMKMKMLAGPHFLLQAVPLESARIIVEFMREVESTF